MVYTPCSFNNTFLKVHGTNVQCKTNVLFGQDMWVSLNDEMLNGWKRIREQGFVYEFDIPILPQNNEEFEKIIRILESDRT